MIYAKSFSTRAEAKRAISRYIELFYRIKKTATFGGLTMSFNNASNPWDYSRNHFNNLYQTGVNAHKSGVKQAKMDVISVKNTVNTFLGTGAGVVVSKVLQPKIPVQAVVVGVGAVASTAVTGVVGYIDGFGKSLGIWGK
jgi:hypothetical protein